MWGHFSSPHPRKNAVTAVFHGFPWAIYTQAPIQTICVWGGSAVPLLPSPGTALRFASGDNKQFLHVLFEPRGSDRMFNLQAKFLFPIVLLCSLSGCSVAPLQFLLISLAQTEASVYSLPPCCQILWMNLPPQCSVVINLFTSLTLVSPFLLVLSRAHFIHLHQPRGFCKNTLTSAKKHHSHQCPGMIWRWVLLPTTSITTLLPGAEKNCTDVSCTHCHRATQ